MDNNVWCAGCGIGLADSDRFCPHCGRPVIADQGGRIDRVPPAGGKLLPKVAADAWQLPTPPSLRRGGRRPVVATAITIALLAAVGGGYGLIREHATTARLALRSRSSMPATSAARTTAVHTSGPPVSTTAAAPPQPADFAALFAQESSGVVRIETIGCSEQGVGTGFLLSPTLVATVNHVVADSTVISLIDGTQRATGTVIGTDPSTDIALVQASRALTGYHFQMATSEPDIGARTATIGFPIADPITLTQGAISGLDRTITVNGTELSGLIETDTPINPGNSGGPLLEADGAVAGLIDAQRTDANGIGYAVPTTTAAPLYTRWTSSPQPGPPTSCTNPLGPPQQAQPSLPGTVGGLTDAQVQGVATTLGTYFDGINTGHYATAYAVLSPRLQQQTSEADFASGDATSFDSGFTVITAQVVDQATVRVDLAFNSLQSPANGPNGEVCDNWTIDYTLVQSVTGGWLIDRSNPHNGSTHTAC